MPQVTIAQWPQPFELGKKRILDAALDAGVPFPHGCGTGECGSCKCRLLEGEVQMEPHSSDALSPAERADGLILACRARATQDVSLRWLAQHAPLPVSKLKAKVAAIERLAHDVVAVRLSLPAGQQFTHHPGQFVRLRFADLPERSYSMAGVSADRDLSFHVRVVPDGAVSPHVADGLRVGDAVEVHGPFGDAYWQGCDTPRLLLLGGGTGLAPVLSVLDAALRDGFPAAQIDLYHGVRTPADLYLGAVLQARAAQQGFRFVPTFAQAGEASVVSLAGARVGHLHEVLAADFADLAHTTIHAAGPPPMVDAVKALAVLRGCAPHRVLADPFHAAPPAAAPRKGLWARLTGRA